MNFVFLLFTTFLLTTQPLRSFHFCKNHKIKKGIDCCCNGDEPCSNNEVERSTKLKKIIDALLRPEKIRPKITIFPKITNEEEDWESGEIPWDFVDNGNVSVALDPHSIAMLMLF
uniref:Uncharacterized protein n=1 Tax=viral metagenome TaxID=1070528 RepID=A0A6C0DE07_9ZZZZ